jgi:hypothetical protein
MSMTTVGDVIPLDPAHTFGLEDVIVISGSSTTYTCNYGSDDYWIMNITGSKSFAIQGGILKYGSLFRLFTIDYYFAIVNGSEDGSLCLSGVEIEFVSKMNSMVFILGGKVTLENVRINNQQGVMWVSPLVLAWSNTSVVTVNLDSCSITNSIYKSTDLSGSAVVYFNTSYTKPISLNVSSCLCYNNTFNLVGDGWGGFSSFSTYDASSSIFSFVFFF